MSFRIDRVSRAGSARRKAEAASDEGEAPVANLPVPVGPVASAPRPDRRAGESGYNAHLLGQDGQKRGLRAGQPLLDQAREAYSTVEWSGSRDRRRRRGSAARTSV